MNPAERRQLINEVESAREQFDKMTEGWMPKSMKEWLGSIGYFTAPAAMKHHGNHEGGLMIHSVEVAKQLRNMTDKLGLKWQTDYSPECIGLLHDVCKCEEYRVKKYGDEVQISWDKDQRMPGHGNKSVVMLLEFAQEDADFFLTKEEISCIMYHMGAFTEKEEWGYYSHAVREWPNVLYTHTADMIASQILQK